MKSFLKYGLLTGIVASLWALSTFTVVGWVSVTFFRGSIPAADMRSIGGLFSIFILGLGIWLGMQEARRRNGGVLGYWQAVKTGVLIACITAGMMAVFSWLYCTVINPGFTEFMVQDAQKTLVAAGKTQAQIAAELVSVRKQFSTGAMVAQALIGQLVVGSGISFLMGILIRKK
ncbi:DUF4199 domain-containing protein [Chitinophaga sp.]|uniref:DUF4199 domain-containing protein n=1 Tax=Chitinophaga sp. TaxID=1869181 RepID=UPI0031DF1FEB